MQPGNKPLLNLPAINFPDLKVNMPVLSLPQLTTNNVVHNQASNDYRKQNERSGDAVRGGQGPKPESGRNDQRQQYGGGGGSGGGSRQQFRGPSEQGQQQKQGQKTGDQQSKEQNQVKKKEKRIRDPRQRVQNVDADHFERLSFMHQLSLLALPIHSGLSRFYMREMRAVSRRCVVRLGPAVRRSYCRKCVRPAALSIRNLVKKGRRGSYLVSKCVRCGFLKRFVFKKAVKRKK